MKHPILNPSPRGFSLVELMIAIVIGMLALVFATRLVLVSEQNKDMSVGGSDSMQNGMQALLAMKNDLEQAGFGLNDPIINGCDTLFYDARDFALAEATRGGVTIKPLTAVVIKNNLTSSDEISMYAGASQSGTGMLGITVDGVGGGSKTIDRIPYGFAQGDVVVAASIYPDDNGRCVISQITSNPSVQPSPPASPFVAMNGAARFNSAVVASGATFLATTSRLFNLGAEADLSFHTWSVKDGYLRLRATNLAGAEKNGTPVMDNIVAIKAQYGFDTRISDIFNDDKGVQQTGMMIAQWSPNMIDADGDGVIGDHDDWARVAAVRLAIVARGRNVEKVKGSISCSATTVPPVLFDSSEPQGVAAVPMTTLNLAVTGDPVDWKCYRYRVFETIVPLRNAGWRPTATSPTT